MAFVDRSSRFIILATLFALVAGPQFARADCPTAVVFESTGTGTADAGWTGIDHDLTLIGPTLHLGVSCGTSTPPCGTCAITGVAPSPVGHPERCAANPAIQCTAATEVADCGAPGTCRTHLGPPESIATGGFQLCLTQSVAGNVGGTVNVETGAFAPTVPIHIELYPAASFTQGCPRCVGDGVPNDGASGGTCDAGLRMGLACDSNTTSPISDFGSTSFDCPAGAAYSFDAGTIAASTGTLTRTLTATSPNCHALGSPTPCFCSTCNTSAAEPCGEHADCPPSGGNPGICGGRRCVGGANNGAPCSTGSECPSGGLCGRPGEPSKPDACLDDTTDFSAIDCLDMGAGNGECINGPVIQFCSNHPNRGCNGDDDCDDVVGACTSKNFPCFPDNGMIGAGLTVSGTATPPVADIADPTDLAALSCVGLTKSSWLDSIGGFPGLVRSMQPGRLTFTDPTVPTPTPVPTVTATPTPLPAPCSAAPAVCRSSLQSGKSSLQLTDRSPDDKDQIQWKWLKGAVTSLADFGNPIASDEYALCFYDGSGLRATMLIPPGDMCAGKPCWRQKSSGFLYRDKDADPDGITQLALKAGADGRAQVQVKGKGMLLPLPPLPSVNAPLALQLRNRTSGLCWGTTFSLPFDKRTDEQLKDTGD